MRLKDDGLTLIELIVVIVIISIIVGISIPSYYKWVKRQSIENDTRILYNKLKQIRIKAFTTKDKYSLCWNSDPFDTAIIKVNGSTEGVISLHHSFATNLTKKGGDCITFSSYGIADKTVSIKIEENDNSNVDCIEVSYYMVSLGKWHNGKCEVQF